VSAGRDSNISTQRLEFLVRKGEIQLVSSIDGIDSSVLRAISE
jgi:hypothetical protein